MTIITTICVHCNRVLRLDAKFLDKSIRCPKCDEVFKVANVAFTPAEGPEVSQEALATRSQPTPARKAPQQSASPMVAKVVDSASGLNATADTPKRPQVSGTSIPRKIGRYEVTKELGRGAFGLVYAARDSVLKRSVAIKVQSQSRNERETTKLLSEAQAAARLRHPNLVAVFEVGTEEGRPFVVSELIEGKSLADRIAEGTIPAQESATLVRDLARGLAYAHAQGLIHRDVKPHNILVGEDDRPQIADFGLAVDRRDEEQARESAYSRSGTLAYMAPEQAGMGGASVGPAVDQYALGATLFEMLTGKRPHTGNSLEILRGLEAPEPPRARSMDSSLPIDLDAICFKAMAHEPWKRYDNCGELADDLDRFLAGELIRGRKISLVERARHFSKRNPKLAAWSVGAAIALSGVLLATSATAVRNVILVRGLGLENRRLQGSMLQRSRDLRTEIGISAPDASTLDDEASQSGEINNADLPLWIAYSRKLNKAVRADAIADTVLSDKLLVETRTEFRDWEYEHLSAAHQGLIAKLTISGNTNGIKLAALGDGESFVVQDSKSIRLIRIRDGSVVAAWQDLPSAKNTIGTPISNTPVVAVNSVGPMVCLQHSPSILYGNARQIEGWDYESKQRWPTLQLTIPCSKLLVSPDDHWLLVLSSTGEYELWDLVNRKLQATETTASGNASFLPIKNAVFSDDSSYFQALRSDGKQSTQLELCSVFTQTKTLTQVQDVSELYANNSRGQTIVAGTVGGIWRLRALENSSFFSVNRPQRPSQLKYRHRDTNGPIVVLSSYPGTLELYVSGSDQPIVLHDQSVDAMDVSPDGRLILACFGTDIFIWDSQSIGNSATSEPTSIVNSMSLSPQGENVAVSDGSVSLIDVATGKKKWEKQNEGL